MTRRGKVLRDPHKDPGLLMIEGQQYPFILEGVWRSAVPAKPGLVVAVDFDRQGSIAGITAVPESQLAKEQADAATLAAKEKSAALAGHLLINFAATVLVAGLLIVGWLFLSAVSIKTPFGRMDLSFWQVLGLLNSNHPLKALMRAGSANSSSTGLYGVLAIIASAAPLLGYFWKDKRASLAGFLPLLFMMAVAVMIRSSMKAISISAGVYLSVTVSVYFAAIGARRYLLARSDGDGQSSH